MLVKNIDPPVVSLHGSLLVALRGITSEKGDTGDLYVTLEQPLKVGR